MILFEWWNFKYFLIVLPTDGFGFAWSNFICSFFSNGWPEKHQLGNSNLPNTFLTNHTWISYTRSSQLWVYVVGVQREPNKSPQLLVCLGPLFCNPLLVQWNNRLANCCTSHKIGGGVNHLQHFNPKSWTHDGRNLTHNFQLCGSTIKLQV